MPNIFEKSLPVSKPKRSVFDLSRDYKTSLNMGMLVPVYLEEIIPGDSFRINSDVMVRFAPLIAPIMDRVDVRLDYFFVPNRLVFDCCQTYDYHLEKETGKFLSFEDFITGGSDGNAIAPVPAIRLTPEHSPIQDNDLLDYFGFRVHGSIDEFVMVPNITPLLAYHLICDNFYMDQTFDSPIMQELKEHPAFDVVDGTWYVTESDDVLARKILTVRNRLFAKDYFTTAMPAPQRGDSVYLMNPLQISANGLISDANIVPNNYEAVRVYSGSENRIRLTDMYGQEFPSDGVNVFVAGERAYASGTPNKEIRFMEGVTQLNGSLNTVENNIPVEGSVDVDVDIESGGEGITINDFFTLQSIQRWLNHNQNFGGRYVEQLVGHFGVVPSDARLNLPQYLGGGKAPVMISEVLQTAAAADEGTTTDIGVGRYAGHAMAFGKTSSINRSFNEHGLVIGILSIIPKISYTSAIPKIFFKNDKFDFAFPEFANIGEQEIKNKEIYFDAANSANNELTFGYTPRYAEYRVAQSISTGDFSRSLSYWHLGRVFSELPTLSLPFLKVDNNNTKRIFQDNSDIHHIYVDVYHNVRAIRPLPLLPNTSLL